MCELTDMIGVEMPTISRHLSQLKNVAILEDEKRGSKVFYRLRAPCVLNFFKCVEDLKTSGIAKQCVWPLVPSAGSRVAAPMANGIKE